jgi:hypothetical protein
MVHVLALVVETLSSQLKNANVQLLKDIALMKLVKLVNALEEESSMTRQTPANVHPFLICFSMKLPKNVNVLENSPW